MNRILIVEDEVPIAQLIEMSLARAGYQCEAVNDGCAAADKIEQNDLGADDYIVKPFEVAELVARVESVLRRTGRGGALLRAWDVTVDTVARSATKAGVPVALTPR